MPPAATIDLLRKEFKFSSFYHPFVSQFIRTLNRDGLDGLFQRPLQQALLNTLIQITIRVNLSPIKVSTQRNLSTSTTTCTPYTNGNCSFTCQS
jgi:hypothetical protein